MAALFSLRTPRSWYAGRNDHVGIQRRQNSLPSWGWSLPLGSAPSSSQLSSVGPTPSFHFRWQDLELSPDLRLQVSQDSARHSLVRSGPVYSNERG